LNADLKSELHSDLQSLHEKWKNKDISLEEDSDIALGLTLGIAIENKKNKGLGTNGPFADKTNNLINSPCRDMIKNYSTIQVNEKKNEKCKRKL
jgi:hypothetical protein